MRRAGRLPVRSPGFAPTLGARGSSGAAPGEAAAVILAVVVAVGLLGLVLAAWEWARVVASAYEYFARVLGVPQARAPKARLPRLFWGRPLLGRATFSAVKRLRLRRSSVRKAPAPTSNSASRDPSPPGSDSESRSGLVVALILAVVCLAGPAALPTHALADGPYTAECEALLEEEDEITGGRENPEWALFLAECEHHLVEINEPGAARPPDFDSFLGGVEAAVAAGGILLIAVVVSMAIRRLVSL